MMIPVHEYTDQQHEINKLFKEMEASSMVKIGMTSEKPLNEQWWYKICKANGIEPSVVEMSAKKWQLAVKYCDLAILGDVRAVIEMPSMKKKFDVTLWWDAAALARAEDHEKVIKNLEEITNKYIILGFSSEDSKIRVDLLNSAGYNITVIPYGDVEYVIAWKGLK